MSHLGMVCPELVGHLNPMTTLGRELQRRGHRVTVVARPDARRKAEAAGLGFAAIGEREFPVGSMQATSAELGKLSGMKAIQFTAELLRRGAAAILQDAPEVIAREKIEALLVDQVAAAGGTVGDQLGLPHVTVCNALAMNPDAHLPPGVLPWRFSPGLLGRARNAFGYALLRWLARPVVNEIERHRAGHGLPALAGGLTASSGLAQIAQQPAFFDFPCKALPGNFHYTAPWHSEAGAEEIPFPWERLDGRTLIYASMGTLQNRQGFIFQTIAAACAGLDAQLVISLGSRDQDAGALAATFAGTPGVGAGADQAIPFGAIATLEGSVTAPGPTPVVQWRKFSGPGTVNFANPAQAATTADFSLPGSYTLMLSADDGVHAVAYDAVTINVVLGAQGSASGNDFIVHFPTLAGRTYQIEASSDLSPTSWMTVDGNIAGNGGFMQIPIGGALSNPRGFYRVKVLP